MMPMVEPPNTYDAWTIKHADETRELLYVLLADVHEGIISPSFLRGKVVNQLIHHHKLATNKEMSDIFKDMRILQELWHRKKFPNFPKIMNLPKEETIETVSKRIKDPLRAYITLLTKKIEG